MRVITGRARGMRLRTLPGQTVRPTAAATKEALFSILGRQVVDCSFLDLFAGSGQIGIEAASRGAKEVILVEKASQTRKVLQNNVLTTGLNDVCKIMPISAERSVEQLMQQGIVFDFIYLDPPWTNWMSIYPKLEKHLPHILAADGRLIAEHEKRQAGLETLTGFTCLRCCSYGSAMLSFFEKQE